MANDPLFWCRNRGPDCGGNFVYGIRSFCQRRRRQRQRRPTRSCNGGCGAQLIAVILILTVRI